MTSSGWLAFTLAELGEFEAARDYLERAHQAAETSGHAYTQTIARTLAGLVWMRRGQLDRALALLQKSLDACREKNLDVWRPIPSSLLGLTCMLLGRADEGLRLLGDGVLLTEELGVKAYLSLWTANLGEGLLVAGQVERARTVAPARPRSRVAHKERGHQAWALRLLGDIAARGVPDEAGAADKAAAYYCPVARPSRRSWACAPSSRATTSGWAGLYRQAGDRDARRGAPRHIEHDAEPARHALLAQARGRGADGARPSVHRRSRTISSSMSTLKQEFSGEPVTVILDRRQGERRETDQPTEGTGSERRAPGTPATSTRRSSPRLRGHRPAEPANDESSSPAAGPASQDHRSSWSLRRLRIKGHLLRWRPQPACDATREIRAAIVRGPTWPLCARALRCLPSGAARSWPLIAKRVSDRLRMALIHSRRWTWRRARANLAGSHPTDMSVLL